LRTAIEAQEVHVNIIRNHAMNASRAVDFMARAILQSLWRASRAMPGDSPDDMLISKRLWPAAATLQRSCLLQLQDA
jgi:hypothetical protein